MNYKKDAYLITCQTNLHVGSGDANYGVVDNLVQRDPLTGVPIIHSSSLKGALREYYKEIWGENSPKLNEVFGPDTSRNPGTESAVGKYKFFDANLIVLPVRSSLNPFYRATAGFLLNAINDRAEMLDVNNFDCIPYNTVVVTKDNPIVEETQQCSLEDFEAKPGLTIKSGINHLGENLALFDGDDFKELVQKLPVIARNHLENGQSKNLWYEEVVPRESRFVFFIAKAPDNEKVTQAEFDELIEKKVIQIGGNASIGYGFTKIKKIS